ncbi:MAG: thioredoxin-like domain-containing protein [Polyangiaceae bacterium]
MKRTSSWAGAALGVGLLPLVLAACDAPRNDLPAPPTTGRSNAVAAGDAGATQKPAVTAPPTAAVTAPGAPRQLCTTREQRPPPKGAIRTASAPGVPPPEATIPFGAGKWIWINLWAAWCGPCKEEMPRLLAWREKLRQSGVLVDMAFVSVDDDERQLARFLETQPATGVRASYWLPEGTTRTSWLAALGVKESPELPVQALVSPSGQVACVVQGAVEERDYPALAAWAR